jgi:hypothetical protein
MTIRNVDRADPSPGLAAQCGKFSTQIKSTPVRHHRFYKPVGLGIPTGGLGRDDIQFGQVIAQLTTD